MVRCWYCGRPAQLVTGLAIYGPGYQTGDKRFWYCKECEAWVGCHKGTEKPLGQLAKRPLRELRVFAHDALDEFRKQTGATRTEAYRLLAERLGISKKACHIGKFDEARCEEAIKIMTEEALK